MSFHFKQALERARTAEGKAEYFLRKVFDTIVPHQLYIDELCFRLIPARSENSSYSIYAATKGGGILYALPPIADYDEAISIFDEVQKQVETEICSLELDKFGNRRFSIKL